MSPTLDIRPLGFGNELAIVADAQRMLPTIVWVLVFDLLLGGNLSQAIPNELPNLF